MTINYNVTGAERKRLVGCIADFLGCKSEYLGAPLFSYKVGYITVGKSGEVSCEDQDSLTEELNALKAELSDKGFAAEEYEEGSESADDAYEAETAAGTENIGLTIEIPLDKADCGKLEQILDAKGELIKKAVGADRIGIEIMQDVIEFPWFDTLPDADEVKAYTDFIAALCRMSKEQTRITATKKDVENEKYAFRCFLLRLGFIGEEYKKDRKILLRNLSGSSAFKSGAKKEAAANEVSE